MLSLACCLVQSETPPCGAEWINPQDLKCPSMVLCVTTGSINILREEAILLCLLSRYHTEHGLNHWLASDWNYLGFSDWSEVYCLCSRMHSAAQLSEQLFRVKDQIPSTHSAQCSKDLLRIMLSEPRASVTVLTLHSTATINLNCDMQASSTPYLFILTTLCLIMLVHERV